MLTSKSKLSIQISITSFKGILVNKPWTLRLAIKLPGQKLETLSENENEPRTKNSLTVRGGKSCSTG